MLHIHFNRMCDQLQDIVAFSTTESEHMSMKKEIKEEIWLQGLIQSLGLKVEKLVLYCDSQSALSLAKKPMYHEKMKHIEVEFHLGYSGRRQVFNIED